MHVPQPPKIPTLDHISPSVYEASLTCLAKAVWYAAAGKGVLPTHPAAILGTCFHSVLAAANVGKLGRESEAARLSGRNLFDREAASNYRGSHPLLQAKFPNVERLPYYNLYRERAALYGSLVAAGRTLTETSELRGVTAKESQVETYLRSTDGLIVGRPDFLDRESGTVVDYKTGLIEGPNEVSEREARQLRLYAYLAAEAGSPVSRGAIVRGDGRKAEIQMSEDEIDTEASKAKTQLQAINTASSSDRTFDDLASPSADNCSRCPCNVVCQRFWQNATPEWVSTCGLYVEGRVTRVTESAQAGFEAITLDMEVQRGTLSSALASVEQIPRAWLTIQDDRLPAVGDVVRITDARHSRTEGDVGVVRVDKTLTAVWVATRTSPISASGHPPTVE